MSRSVKNLGVRIPSEAQLLTFNYKFMRNSVSIHVENELGLSYATSYENPTVKQLVHEFVGIAKDQGFSNMQVYIALMEESERVARKILAK